MSHGADYRDSVSYPGESQDDAILLTSSDDDVPIFSRPPRVQPDAESPAAERSGSDGHGPGLQPAEAPSVDGQRQAEESGVPDGLVGSVELSRTSRCRCVIITAHVENMEAYRAFLGKLSALCDDGVSLKFATGQLERAPSTGQLHIQAVCGARSQLRFRAWKNLLGATVHFQSVRSLPKSIAYCNKAETRVEPPFSFGETPRGRGTRTDLLTVRDSILGGSKTWDLYNDHFESYARYNRFFNQFRILHQQRQRREKGYAPPTVYIYHGHSGTGKSRRAEYEATAKYGVHGWYRLTSSWFDGYDGEPGLIIDEFYGFLTPHQFLQLLDGYSNLLPVKHSGAVSHFETIWITSNSAPEEWWPNLRASGKFVPEWDAAIRRRCSDVVAFDRSTPWVPPSGAASSTPDDPSGSS